MLMPLSLIYQKKLANWGTKATDKQEKLMKDCSEIPKMSSV